MHTRIVLTLAAVVVTAFCSEVSAQALSAADRAIVSDADTLVQQAVSADKAGDAQLRESLLEQAVEVDPNNELARWLMGQVQFGREWKTIEEVQELVANDGRWAEYRRRVGQADDSLSSQLALAHWCRRAHLNREEAWHWQKVLQLAPNHPEALDRLGLERYQGELYTKKELNDLREAKRAFGRYKPKFDKIVRNALSESDSRRKDALAELSAVEDPAAIAALSESLKIDNPYKEKLLSGLYPAEAGIYIEQLHQAGVEALARMDEYEATVKLVEVAVLSEYANVRQAATQALVGRPKTDYMPMLMDGMKPPLELSIEREVSAGGGVTVTNKLFETGREADRKIVRKDYYLTTTRHVREATRETWVEYDTARDLSYSYRLSALTETWLEAENWARQERNNRIQEVLAILTGLDLESDAERWWQTWKEYNELEDTPEKPIHTEEEFRSLLDYKLVNDTYGTYRFTLNRPTGPSCFAAGTPVWTQSGPKPIEQIEAGELVLSQKPVTGQLDYRPVLETTVRQPSPVSHITIDDETITATLGHRFWVTGHGWRMAKFLKPGYLLYSTQGSTELLSIEEGTDTEAFNLVVDDFHTYFVGNHQLLVHDNELPEHSLTVVPGVELSPEAPGPAPVVNR